MKTTHRASKSCVCERVSHGHRTRVPTLALQDQQCKWAPQGGLAALLLEETQLQSITQRRKKNMGEMDVVSYAFK